MEKMATGLHMEDQRYTFICACLGVPSCCFCFRSFKRHVLAFVCARICTRVCVFVCGRAGVGARVKMIVLWAQKS